MFRNVTPKNHSLCSFYFQYILWKLLNQHTQWYESERMARFDKHCRLFSNCGHLYATEHFLWFIILFLLFGTISSVYQAVSKGDIFNTVRILTTRIPWHTVLWTFTSTVQASNHLFKSIFRLTATTPLKLCVTDPMYWDSLNKGQVMW